MGKTIKSLFIAQVILMCEISCCACWSNDMLWSVLITKWSWRKFVELEKQLEEEEKAIELKLNQAGKEIEDEVQKAIESGVVTEAAKEIQKEAKRFVNEEGKKIETKMNQVG